MLLPAAITLLSQLLIWCLFLLRLVDQVILPEGAHNVVALPPFEGVSEARTERFTFLDTTGSGRPVVIMKMKNVVKEHNVMLKVR